MNDPFKLEDNYHSKAQDFGSVLSFLKAGVRDEKV